MMFTCDICGKEFDKKGKLSGHKRFVHPAGPARKVTATDSSLPDQGDNETVAPEAIVVTDVFIPPKIAQPEAQPPPESPPSPPPPSPPDIKAIIEGTLSVALPILLEQMGKRMAEEREAILAQSRAELSEAVNSIATVLDSLSQKGNNGDGEDNSWKAALLSIFAPKPDTSGNLMEQLKLLELIGNTISKPRQEGFSDGSNFAANMFLLATKGGATPEASASALRTLIPPPSKANAG